MKECRTTKKKKCYLTQMGVGVTAQIRTFKTSEKIKMKILSDFLVSEADHLCHTSRVVIPCYTQCSAQVFKRAGCHLKRAL